MALAIVVVFIGLYLSLFFFPYPLFRHHTEHAGFSVYSDREIPDEFHRVLDDARFRVNEMELYRGARDLRIFVCRSQRLFVLLNRLAGKSHAGQALVISVTGNAFFSGQGIEAVGRRNGGRPLYSRLEGSWSAAIAHEVAHDLVVAEVGTKRARGIPVWISEGYADYAANRAAAASGPEYDFAGRVDFLLDDEHWRPPAPTFDRRHFRWHVLVEYLCSERGLTFSELIGEQVDERVDEQTVRSLLMSWRHTSGSLDQ